MNEYAELMLNELMKKASKKDAAAQAELANRLFYGIGVEKDTKWAGDFAQKAYNAGKTDIVGILGQICYANNDIQTAFKYYSDGAKYGYTECYCGLADIYSQENGPVEKNEKLAYEYITRAATESVGTNDKKLDAILTAAQYAANGIGIEKNIAIAKNWYFYALEKGYEYAKIKIAELCISENELTEGEIYALECMESSNEEIAETGKQLFAEVTKKRIEKIDTPEDIDNAGARIDALIKKQIEKTNEIMHVNVGIDKEADRLVKNAQLFAKIGDPERVIKTYARVVEEHPSDFRGWYNMARVVTGDFSTYSVFLSDGYGKMAQSDYEDNMLYALKTSSGDVFDSLKLLSKTYSDGCVELSILHLKELLLGLINNNASEAEIILFFRQYFDKIEFLYKSKPCAITEMTYRLGKNIINNDNILTCIEDSEYLDKFVGARVEDGIDEILAEAAQKLCEKQPKRYPTVEIALEYVYSQEYVQDKINEKHNEAEEKKLYFTNVENIIKTDIIQEKQKADASWEYDDEFVDVIILLAYRCSIFMFGRINAYSPNGVEQLQKEIENTKTKEKMSKRSHELYCNVASKYIKMTTGEDMLIVKLNEAIDLHKNLLAEQEKVNSSHGLGKMFKSKEIEMKKAELLEEVEASEKRLEEVRNEVYQHAKEDVKHINEQIKAEFSDSGVTVELYDEDILDTVTIMRIEELLSK